MWLFILEDALNYPMLLNSETGNAFFVNNRNEVGKPFQNLEIQFENPNFKSRIKIHTCENDKDMRDMFEKLCKQFNAIRVE